MKSHSNLSAARDLIIEPAGVVKWVVGGSLLVCGGTREVVRGEHGKHRPRIGLSSPQFRLAPHHDVRGGRSSNGRGCHTVVCSTSGPARPLCGYGRLLDIALADAFRKRRNRAEATRRFPREAGGARCHVTYSFPSRIEPLPRLIAPLT
jgi:hypothetical protein